MMTYIRSKKVRKKKRKKERSNINEFLFLFKKCEIKLTAFESKFSGLFWLFCPNLGRQAFSRRLTIQHFKVFIILYLYKKNGKKTYLNDF